MTLDASRHDELVRLRAALHSIATAPPPAIPQQARFCAMAQRLAQEALAAAEAPPAQTSEVPETIYKAVERVLDENSAWIARPSKDVTEKVALAAGIAWQMHAPHSPEAGAPSREAIAKKLYGYNAYIERLWVSDPSAPYEGAVKWNDDAALAIADAILALYPTPPALKASELGSEELRERLIAILDPIAYSLPDFRESNVNNGADQILALFSAVSLSTISEGWRLEAERWRALMRCGRIKMQGSAGVDPDTGERRGSNVHFGAEFWPKRLPDDYRAKHPEEAANYDRNTRWGLACLTALADAIIERDAPPALVQPPEPPTK